MKRGKQVALMPNAQGPRSGGFITIPIEEYEAMKALIAALTAKVAELEARLNKNSKNSNKPPSSDGPKKSAIKNSRVKSGRQSGGQPGREGKTLELVPEPDTVVELKPKQACECGGSIIESASCQTRQVTDIEPIKLLTFEYRAYDGACEACGKTHRASFPDCADGVRSYGDGLSAVAAYLTNYQLLPLKRATELMQDIFGISMSQATVLARSEQAYEMLEKTEGLIADEILASPVAHADETGMRVQGSNHWLHSVGTEKATVYGIRKGRGKKALDDIGVLPRYTGTLVHDHWKSYYGYDQCSHAECNAHHLRALRHLHEDLGCEWAGDMASLLLRIKRHVDLCKLFEAERIEQPDIELYIDCYRGILAGASSDGEAEPDESRRMRKRLGEYELEALLFMLDFDVPFTNNLAESDVRMPKTKMKISGCFRTKHGADVFARVRGFISTAKKKGKNILAGLASVFSGDSAAFLYPET